LGEKKRVIPPGKNDPGRTAGELLIVLQVAILSIGIAWLLYDAPWGILSGLPLYPVYRRLYRQEKIRAREGRMTGEFKELLLLLSTYMQTGYSLENAFVHAEQELDQMQQGNSLLKAGIHELNQKVTVNVPVEQAFLALADEMDMEEGYEFGEMLLFAKRLGGNYNRNIQKTAAKIEDKISIYQEIETMTAEKSLEMKIMMLMPVFIIGYIRITSGEFISGLYHNALGISAMTGCLCLYLFMVLLGQKIIQIRV
jgi:tight adherence protein B